MHRQSYHKYFGQSQRDYLFKLFPLLCISVRGTQLHFCYWSEAIPFGFQEPEIFKPLSRQQVLPAQTEGGNLLTHHHSMSLSSSQLYFVLPDQQT